MADVLLRIKKRQNGYVTREELKAQELVYEEVSGSLVFLDNNRRISRFPSSLFSIGRFVDRPKFYVNPGYIYYSYDIGRWEIFDGYQWYRLGGGTNIAGIPSGGTAGQILRKSTDEDFDVVWSDETGEDLFHAFLESDYLFIENNISTLYWNIMSFPTIKFELENDRRKVKFKEAGTYFLLGNLVIDCTDQNYSGKLFIKINGNISKTILGNYKDNKIFFNFASLENIQRNDILTIDIENPTLGNLEVTDTQRLSIISLDKRGPIGPRGEKGDRGLPFFIDVIDRLSNRSNYDNTDLGFVFMDENTYEIYFRIRDRQDPSKIVWSRPIPFRGPAGAGTLEALQAKNKAEEYMESALAAAEEAEEKLNEIVSIFNQFITAQNTNIQLKNQLDNLLLLVQQIRSEVIGIKEDLEKKVNDLYTIKEEFSTYLEMKVEQLTDLSDLTRLFYVWARKYAVDAEASYVKVKSIVEGLEGLLDTVTSIKNETFGYKNETLAYRDEVLSTSENINKIYNELLDLKIEINSLKDKIEVDASIILRAREDVNTYLNRFYSEKEELFPLLQDFQSQYEDIINKYNSFNDMDIDFNNKYNDFILKYNEILNKSQSLQTTLNVLEPLIFTLRPALDKLDEKLEEIDNKYLQIQSFKDEAYSYYMWSRYFSITAQAWYEKTRNLVSEIDFDSIVIIDGGHF